MEHNILVTNDDGINAKGLRALIEVASSFGHVTVVAPEMGMSGMSHSVTLSNPLYLRQIKRSKNIDVFACHGTPVDCVKIAIDYLMKEKPTLILSGINHGANTNISVIYSGTMGAATEGSTYGTPSLGLSVISHDTKEDMTAAVYYSKKIITDVIEKNNNPHLCLNVNVPTLPLDEIKGIKICRQTKGYWKETFEKETNPRGLDYYWLTGEFLNKEPLSEDTDEWAIKNGYVSIVPVKTDMTDYNQLEQMKLWSL